MTHLRTIRSYVRRQGRMTLKHKQALNEYWLKYGCELEDFSGPDDTRWQDLFCRQNDLILEIGFGMGGNLIQMAKENPDNNYLGVEVHTPGMAATLSACHQFQLDNIRLIREDSHEVLAKLPLGGLSKVYVLFPDPWPKTRHHKRRIIQPNFLDLVISRLKPKGTLHLATDWLEYAHWMLQTCESHSGVENKFGQGEFAPTQFARFETKFEQRGKKLGHPIRDLVFLRK